eukprot:TRINITY_DN19238_c0_g1_i1.p1 TRINITY_DN19238_c0_g1~~TRINITY_DN19238_c0_g1_i1.p1  ORF type:complete len:383 (+),score=58.67 TRINITY_DN19238_c0_g1_i1:91-1239(+)
MRKLFVLESQPWVQGVKTLDDSADASHPRLHRAGHNKDPAKVHDTTSRLGEFFGRLRALATASAERLGIMSITAGEGTKGRHASQKAASSAGKRDEIRALVQRSKFPRRGRVAIVVRGRAFRLGGRFGLGCKVRALDTQREEANSLVTMVVDPLLAKGNSVDMFVSESSGTSCSLTKDLVALYDSLAKPRSPKERSMTDLYTTTHLDAISRPSSLTDMYAQGTQGSLQVFHHNSPRSVNQRSGLIAALNFFKQKTYNRQQYDLVLVVRHDLLWKQPIDEWQITGDYSELNFMSRCEPTTKVPNCVNDMVWTMPGSMFDGFEKSIGHRNCFQEEQCRRKGMCHGHGCKQVMMNLTHSKAESYLTKWIPKRDLRERTNPLAKVR